MRPARGAGVWLVLVLPAACGTAADRGSSAPAIRGALPATPVVGAEEVALTAPLPVTPPVAPPVWSVVHPDVTLPLGPPRGRLERRGDELLGWAVSADVGLRLGDDGQLFADPGAIALGDLGGWRLGCLADAEACEPTLHRSNHGVEEAWSLLDDRLWHRYIVQSVGGPELALKLHLGNGAVSLSGADVAVESVDASLVYAEARAWDATGKELTARLDVADDETVLLRVDTAGARAPISIDPWLMPAPRAVSFENWREGTNFRSGGDINGDGWQDLVVSEGAASIYYCDAAGVPPTSDVRRDGEPWPQRRPVDLNGDGLGDTLSSLCGSGSSVYFGVAGGDPVLGPSIPKPYTSFWHGCNDEAADIDGDGYQDLVMAEARNNYESSFVVYKGGPTLTSWTRLASPVFEYTYPYVSAWPHVTTGDINGDGFADVLLTSPHGLATDPAYQNPNWFTRSWLYYGGPSGMEPNPAWVLSDLYASLSEQPFWADAVEDVNGDGYDDIVFGGMQSTVWWVPGGPIAPGAPRQLGTYEMMYQEPDQSRRYAVGISGIGDVNGDGYNDIGVETGAGGAVLLGSPEGPIEPPYVMLNVAPHGNLVVANKVGDLNGDGYDELALGAPFNNQWPDAPGYPNNSVFIWYGEDIPDIDQDGTLNAADCHPYVASAHPGAPEVPGTKWDEDCDGTFTCFSGVDGDGDGVIGRTTVTLPFNPAGCEAAGAYVAAPDCDDADPLIGPFAQELADNAVDENCDGRSLCHADLDGDGFGGLAVAVLDVPACDLSPAWNQDGLDCDDARADVNPGMMDLGGSAVDEDCDGLARCFVDGDGDGYGGMYPDAWSVDNSCVHPGMGDRADDCDDVDADIHPGATVVPSDDVDDDCNGLLECHFDGDNDTWGSTTIFQFPISCGETYMNQGVPYHMAARGGDCDDRDRNAFPGAPELGWSGDMNCDGLETCTLDEDGDQYHAPDGPAVQLPDCNALGVGYGGDCDDQEPRVHPYAYQYNPANVDVNCDGYWYCYTDRDGDGYGSVVSDIYPRQPCDETSGLASTGGDCADRDAARSPGLAEVVGDRIDQDCDNRLACWIDADHDGWGSPGVVQRNVTTCAAPATGLSQRTGDCDDLSTLAHPGLLDRGGDGVDVDCDGADGLTLAVDASTRTFAMTAHGAGGGARVTFVVSTTGPGQGPCPPALGGACAGLLNPRVVTTVTADAEGAATARVTVPANVPFGFQTAWQAWVVGPTPAEGSALVGVVVP